MRIYGCLLLLLLSCCSSFDNNLTNNVSIIESGKKLVLNDLEFLVPYGANVTYQEEKLSNGQTLVDSTVGIIKLKNIEIAFSIGEIDKGYLNNIGGEEIWRHENLKYITHVFQLNLKEAQTVFCASSKSEGFFSDRIFSIILTSYPISKNSNQTKINEAVTFYKSAFN